MAWENPRTASHANSIWLDLPEDIFRQHLVELEAKTNNIPMDPQVFSAEEWLATSPRESAQLHTLPLAIEQQVADDFAFLAAVTEGAQSVAAVCLEEQSKPPGLTLRFATLDSLLNNDIKIGLQGITQILMETASSNTTTTEEGTIDRLLNQIITLHHHRLLARLRSTKWSKPTYLSKSHKKPLYNDFSTLLHRAQHLYTKREKSQKKLIETHLNSLATIYSSFESTPSSPASEISTLKILVNKSFTFCSLPSVSNFTTRLLHSQKARKPTPQIASAIKTLRQIEKIASYRRVCIALLTHSKTYPDLFRDVKMEFVTPYRAVETSIGFEEWARRMHVHAEVQLVVFYDLRMENYSSALNSNFTPTSDLNLISNTTPLPRCIGTSKHLCYLCYHFLHSHGKFFPARTHGRLYDQWTIPDLSGFSEEMRSSYRGIIKMIDGEVRRRSGEIGDGEEGWRLMPMTSVDLGPFEGDGLEEVVERLVLDG